MIIKLYNRIYKVIVMAIKNWIVKTKQIKKKSDGLINHYNYLFDKNRPSHATTNIVDLNNSPNKLINIINEYEGRQAERKKNGIRGGGVSNLATSFVMSLPKDIDQPTTEQWKKIISVSLREMAKDLKMDLKTLQKNSVVVLHDESLNNDKSSHVHILTSNIIDGQVFKPLSQLKATYAMKNGFNKGVKQVLGVDNLKYEPETQGVKDKPLWLARNEKLKKMKKEILKDKKNAETLNNKNKKDIEEIKNIKNDIEEVKKEIQIENKNVLTIFENFKELFKNWIKSFNGDHNQTYSNTNKLAKNIISMSYEDKSKSLELLGFAVDIEEDNNIKDVYKVSDSLKREYNKNIKDDEIDGIVEEKRKRRKRTNRP